MGVKVFRGDNWARIQSGAISLRDIMCLDKEEDIELIGYLLRHASREYRASVFEYAAEKYGICEIPKAEMNTDDPDDPYYEEYIVLREQVVREEDFDVLKKTAVHGSDYCMAAFAFCRLTGYSFPSSECDAYSYRTFGCGILSGMTGESISGICLEVIGERGLLADAAEKYLRAGIE
ncbi:MAG: hypothetical protein IKE18_06310 [Oscillospiraceae bacterium]|nr:hypothetical protein [Oscillospiraceae bacterium]